MNNVIVGNLWVDNHGEMEITNHHNGDKCHLKYSAYSYFSREEPRKVRKEGEEMTRRGAVAHPLERATPGEEVPGLIPAVAACSLLV